MSVIKLVEDESEDVPDLQGVDKLLARISSDDVALSYIATMGDPMQTMRERGPPVEFPDGRSGGAYVSMTIEAPPRGDFSANTFGCFGFIINACSQNAEYEGDVMLYVGRSTGLNANFIFTLYGGKFNTLLPSLTALSVAVTSEGDEYDRMVYGSVGVRVGENFTSTTDQGSVFFAYDAEPLLVAAMRTGITGLTSFTPQDVRNTTLLGKTRAGMTTRTHTIKPTLTGYHGANPVLGDMLMTPMIYYEASVQRMITISVGAALSTAAKDGVLAVCPRLPSCYSPVADEVAAWLNLHRVTTANTFDIFKMLRKHAASVRRALPKVSEYAGIAAAGLAALGLEPLAATAGSISAGAAALDSALPKDKQPSKRKRRRRVRLVKKKST